MEEFRSLGVSETVLAALEQKGFDTPTPIQALTIPLLLNGDTDLVAQAQTGTGKTAAFGIPVLDRAEERAGFIQAIILTPTRELCMQVASEIESLKGKKRLSIVTVYGGQSISLQIKQLKKGADIVVGTPGRVIDMLERGVLDLQGVKYVVLDEADEMLNMGFAEDVERILQSVNPARRMLLFSATMPQRILQLAKTYMGNYQNLVAKREDVTTALIDQVYYEVRADQKFNALARLIDVEDNFYGVIFCRTKAETAELAQQLEGRGYPSEALHGDVAQAQREKILQKFRDRKTQILVATDVAARGIDVTDLSHVVNYHLPYESESYVHRIGRTGRAGKQGTAISLVSPSERRLLGNVRHAAKAEIRLGKLPTNQEVLQRRLNGLKEQVTEVVAKGGTKDFNALAVELLSQYSAEETVAALLKHAAGPDITNMPEIQPMQDRRRDSSERGDRSDRRERSDDGNQTRLFVAMGRRDDMSKTDLLNYIQQETGIRPARLGKIEMFDSHAYINLGEAEAEKILQVFTTKYGRQNPLFTAAPKEKRAKSSNSGWGGDRDKKRAKGSKGSKSRSW